MKEICKTLIPLFALLLTVAIPLSAQQEDQNEEGTKVTIITKTIDENGNEVIKKIIKEGVAAEEFTEENEFHFDTDEEGEVEVRIFRSKDDDHKDIHIDVDEEGGQKRIRIKGVDENGEEFNIEWEGEGEIPVEIQEKMNSMGDHEGMHPRRKMMRKRFERNDHGAFLGVKIGKKIENINGVETITGVSDLGVVVNGVVEGSAAEAAGLQSEDIITAINGQSVKNMGDLTDQLQEYKTGDKIRISYLRNDQSKEVEATLLPKKFTSKGGRFQWHSDDNKVYRFNSDDYFRKPCKPFIGVYLNLGNHSEEGVAVQRIIPNTPASEVNLQIGDLITAIDEVEVNSHSALIQERDKHAPGDQFTLTYLRDGASNTVTATFPTCDENTMAEGRKIIIIKKNKEEEEEENINVSPEKTNPFIVPESNLTLTNFSSFPNPTVGLVTVQFQGEPGPTTILINDIAGKELYREELNNFDGYYNNQIDLSKEAAGTLLLTIRQENQIFTDKIILRKDN